MILRNWIDLDNLKWTELSINENAIHILENNLDKVNWYWLSRNKNAIHILENNLDKVEWNYLSCNKNAIHILKNNLDKVDWYNLSQNENIFTYDYKKMHFLMESSGLKEEIINAYYSPNNVSKFIERGDLDKNANNRWIDL